MLQNSIIKSLVHIAKPDDKLLGAAHIGKLFDGIIKDAYAIDQRGFCILFNILSDVMKSLNRMCK